MKLFRVYTHTLGDKSITERLVAAATEAEARISALANVKAQNLGKGCTSQEDSQNNTTILSVKECGRDGVLATNRIPVASIESIFAALSAHDAQTTADFQDDMRKLAGLPDGSPLEEVTVVLSTMVAPEESCSTT